MSDETAKAAATPRRELERQIMDSGVPKNEREHWAAREIAMLRDDLAAANAERKRYREDGKLLWRYGLDQTGVSSMMAEDNARMRKAGCALAEASLHVIREYDGLHRLSLAVADWCQAVADEGRRAVLQTEVHDSGEQQDHHRDLDDRLAKEATK